MRQEKIARSSALHLLPILAIVCGVGIGWAGCNGAASLHGSVKVPKQSYGRGSNVRVLISVPNGAVGTHIRIQKKIGNTWKEVADYNPEKKCPEMEERAGGGYRFVTKRSPRCRHVEGSWTLTWSQMTSKQCQDSAGPVSPGVYRICVARFAKKCQVREGSFGFERPRGASKFICSQPFTVR
jgi:hypothetical protein